MIKAEYSGTTNFGGSSATIDQIVTVEPPTITKAFGVGVIALKGTTSLTFTIANPNLSAALAGIGFSDTLPAGLAVDTPNGLSNTCGGSVTAVAGSSSVSLSGGTVAANASCTLSVNVRGIAAGTQSNTTGPVTATESGTGSTSNTATLTVITALTIAMAFGAPTMSIGQSTSLSFTITNPNATTAITGIGFTDSLPNGLVVATPNGLAGSCGGGTITAAPGSHAVSLAGATLAAGASCTFSVNVTATSAGARTNTVTVSASGPIALSSAAATASITVLAPDLAISKHHTGNLRRGVVGSYQIVVSNGGPGASAGLVTAIDYLPIGLDVVSVSAAGWSCRTSTLRVTCTRSDTLAAGSWWPTIVISVRPSALAQPVSVNAAHVSSTADRNASNDIALDPTRVTF
jgi:uncharacterized repeat protein (TIGR01451 family)